LAQLQRRWNGVIDEYILAGHDKRSEDEIARAAKIGISMVHFTGAVKVKGVTKWKGEILSR
jgi:hypothetical protein